jgi:single-strand DNA-binding protein
MNKVILIGRLGKEPESRFTQSNMQVVNFSLATSKKVKGEEQTEWHNVVTFSKTAEIAEKYLTKGSLVCVEGSIQTSKYEKDGQTRYSTQIVCDRLEMLGSKDEQKPEQKTSNIDLNDIDDDLPF